MAQHPATVVRTTMFYFVRFLCIFLLLFAAITGITRAFAADSEGTGPAVAGIELQQVDTTGARTTVSDSSSKPAELSIRSRGGSIQFGTRITWTDDSIDDDYYAVTWDIAGDTDIAKISSGGILSANGTADGEVTVTATVPADISDTGEELTASANVKITSQTDARYVSKITICDEDGTKIKNCTLTGDVSTALVTFTAKVKVADPSDGSTETYWVTANNSLSSQASDLPDITWSVNDTTLGYIDSVTGMYRPLIAATNQVKCVCTAGPDGTRVVSTINVMMEGESSDDRHPQDSVWVYVTYEDAPDTIVAEETYGVDELEALGSVTVTYTCVRKGSGYGFFTRTGYGPYVAIILQDVGVTDTDSVRSVDTVSYDGPDTLSGSVLFNTKRYYFPNYSNNGSHAGKIQVAPILAISSYTWPDGEDGGSSGSYPDDDEFVDDIRFCLMYGATTSDTNNSQHQRKWINTMHVVLKGGPPVPDDTDDTDDTDEPSNENDSETNDSTAAVGGSSGSGSGNSQSGGSGDSDLGAAAGSNSSDGSSESEEVTDDTGDGTGAGGNSGGFSIYQMMNPFDNDVASIDEDNPLEPYVLPVLLAVLIAGFIEKYLEYRQQIRVPKQVSWGSRIAQQT